MGTKMTFEDIGYHATELAEAAIASATSVEPEAMGLDARSAGRLYVGADWVAVAKSRDRNLQYYGGFEYVGDEFRFELGDYVFYSAENNRVGEHVAILGDEK